ncbi:molecular chaperone [Aestuariispira insulae]|nr:molecular chaperone [Aestuariispira insulae]
MKKLQRGSFGPVLGMIFMLSLATASQAQEMMLWPKRQIIQDGNQTSSFLVINNSLEPALVRITFQKRMMSLVGALEQVSDDTAHECFADPADFQISPRQFTLQGNTQQEIKIIQRAPLAAGKPEERVHLAFNFYPSPDSLPVLKASSGQQQENNVTLIGLTAQIVPLFKLRQPAAETDPMEIEKIRLMPTTNGGNQLAIKIRKSVARSIRGNLQAHYIAPTQGAAPVLLGHVKGVAAYCELDEMLVRLPVDSTALTEARAQYPGGKLSISFNETSKVPYPVVIERDFPL